MLWEEVVALSRLILTKDIGPFWDLLLSFSAAPIFATSEGNTRPGGQEHSITQSGHTQDPEGLNSSCAFTCKFCDPGESWVPSLFCALILLSELSV